MATLVDRVRGISQSSTNQTSDAEVVEFLKGGATILINSIPKELLGFAGTDSSSITTSGGYTITSDRILGVRRNGIECDPITLDKAYAQDYSFSSATSIYKATAIFPKYYTRASKIYIKPNPTTAQVGVVTYINVPSITTTTVSTTFVQIEEPLITYAAALDCLALAGHSTDVHNYIDEEDTEMMRELLTREHPEIQRAAQLFKQATEQAAIFVKMNSKMISLGAMMGGGQ